jgi:hypothetical protein
MVETGPFNGTMRPDVALRHNSGNRQVRSQQLRLSDPCFSDFLGLPLAPVLRPKTERKIPGTIAHHSTAAHTDQFS